MKKMLKAAAVLAAMVMALTLGACSNDDDGGSSSGSKLSDKGIKAVYDSPNYYGTSVLVFYNDGKFVHATIDNGTYSISDDRFEIIEEGTYTGDPTKDTGDDNKVLLTYTKISDLGLYNVSPEEFCKEFPEWHLEDFTDLEATITDNGGYFKCGKGHAYITGYSRNEDY